MANIAWKKRTKERDGIRKSIWIYRREWKKGRKLTWNAFQHQLAEIHNVWECRMIALRIERERQRERNDRIHVLQLTQQIIAFNLFDCSTVTIALIQSYQTRRTKALCHHNWCHTLPFLNGNIRCGGGNFRHLISTKR